MTDTSFPGITAAARGPARRGLVSRVLFALAVRRQRRTLAELDPRQLADIGVSPDQARAEASRPIWDVPAGWRL